MHCVPYLVLALVMLTSPSLAVETSLLPPTLKWQHPPKGERCPSYAARLNTFFGFEAEKEAGTALELEDGTEMESLRSKGCKSNEEDHENNLPEEINVVAQESSTMEERPTEVTNPISIMGSSETKVKNKSSITNIPVSKKDEESEETANGEDKDEEVGEEEEEEEEEEEGYDSMQAEPIRQRGSTTVPPEQRLTKHRHKKHDVVGALASDFSDNEGDESEEEDDDSITDTETLAVKAVSHGSYGPQGESSLNGGQGSKVISPTAPTQVAIDKEATVLSALCPSSSCS